MSFGEILKEIRNKNDDSLRALAEKLDVSFTYIDNIEKEKRPISNGVFEKLLEVYPVDKQKLLEAYCDETLSPSLKGMILSDKKQDELLNIIFELLQTLDIENKKSIIDLIVEKIEYNSLKHGKYDEVKDILEEAKKINHSR